MPDIELAIQEVEDTGKPKTLAELLNPEGKFHKKLIGQFEDEYQLGWHFMRPKIQEWGIRLKVYNNQKRDKDKVGDPTMFAIHQSVLAPLYDDKQTESMVPSGPSVFDIRRA